MFSRKISRGRTFLRLRQFAECVKLTVKDLSPVFLSPLMATPRSHRGAGGGGDGVVVRVTGTPAENSGRKWQHLIIRQF